MISEIPTFNQLFGGVVHPTPTLYPYSTQQEGQLMCYRCVDRKLPVVARRP